jgi:hypothetical protein
MSTPFRARRVGTCGEGDASRPPRDARRGCLSGSRTYSTKREFAARLRLP